MQTINRLVNESTNQLFRKYRRIVAYRHQMSSPEFSKDKTRIFDCEELVPGDHLLFKLQSSCDVHTDESDKVFVYTFHAIFIETVHDTSSEILLRLICYVESVKDIYQLLHINVEPKDQKRFSCPSVVSIQIPLKSILSKNVKAFKYLHKKVKRDDVIRRARNELLFQRNNETWGNSVVPTTNESFVSYCLSGVRGIVVFVNPNKLNLKKIAELGGTQIIGQAIESGAKVGLVVAANSIGKYSSNAALQTIAKGTGKVAGPVLGSAVEVTTAGFNIASKKRQLDRGELTKHTFGTSVTKEVTKTSGAIVGGVGGSIIGQTTIPIPIVGGIAGGIVGGILGGLCGVGTGKAIAKISDKIRNEIKTRRDETIFYSSNNDNPFMLAVQEDVNNKTSLNAINTPDKLHVLQEMLLAQELEAYEDE